mgnify:CR=1 FL=1
MTGVQTCALPISVVVAGGPRLGDVESGVVAGVAGETFSVVSGGLACIAVTAALGVTTLAIRNVGGTDHLPFDRVGLPGFQFIQDQLEYDSRTHHSNMDVYDRVQRNDIMQMAAFVASFVYNAANREELLPRKPLPKPQPPPPAQAVPQTPAPGVGVPTTP